VKPVGPWTFVKLVSFRAAEGALTWQSVPHEASAGALPVANVLGEIEGAALHIIQVGELSRQARNCAVRIGRETPLLDDLTIDTRVGTPTVEILQAAREMKARLIVMCKHRSTERGKMPGRTAMKVLHDAPCPVVLVPPERGATPWHLHHVMVPHDGTHPPPSAALRPAAELAERGRAVVHVTDIKAAPAEPGSLTTPRYLDQPQDGWPPGPASLSIVSRAFARLTTSTCGCSSPMAQQPRRCCACPKK
jgi:nucleotide-binding universal stress UspA family protein